MEILGQYPIKISIPHNTQLTWYLIQIPDTQPDPKYFFNTRTQPDPKLKNPTRLTLNTEHFDTYMKFLQICVYFIMK